TDGSRVAFVSFATNLVPGFANSGGSEVYVRNLTTAPISLGTISLASANLAGTDDGNGGSGVDDEGAIFLSLSEDGHCVAFPSTASDLVANDTNGGLRDVFVRNILINSTTLVSTNSTGTGSGNDDSDEPHVTADCSRVVFISDASDLVATDTNGGTPRTDAFVRDLAAMSPTLVSVNAAGNDSGNGNSFVAAISDSRVAFVSSASDLVATDTNGGAPATDVFLRDLSNNTTALVSRNLADTDSGNFGSGDATLSPDGSLIGFVSFANDLVAADSNGFVDVFVSVPPLPMISIDNVSVTEGDSGTVTASFTVTLSKSSTSTVTVDFQTVDGTATDPADYLAGNGVVTLLPGDTSEPIDITVNGDVLIENDETFFVGLANPVNAGISNPEGVGTILNDDSARPDLSINDVVVTEGTGGTTNLAFTVSLSAASGQAVSVNFATANSTAVQPADYTVTSGTVNFPAGSTSDSTTISIPVAGDTKDEPDESFFVNLSSVVNANILDGQGVGTINDDDAPPTLSINDVSIPEGNAGNSNATFTVTLSEPSGFPIMVDYATADGSATTASGDYEPAGGTLTIPAEAPSGQILVGIGGDTDMEVDENFTVTLSNAVNASIADGIGQGTITNDDGADFTITAFPRRQVVHSNLDTASYNVTVHLTSSLPLAQPVDLACIVPPGLARTCTFSSSSVTAPGTVTMTLGMVSASKSKSTVIYALWMPLTATGLLGLLLVRRLPRRRKGHSPVTLLLLVLLMIVFGSACPGNRTFHELRTVTIVGTSGNIQRSTTVELVIFHHSF
ncbi:MAG: Calx-beta domain-containing protein, partial [bacterium]